MEDDVIESVIYAADEMKASMMGDVRSEKRLWPI